MSDVFYPLSMVAQLKDEFIDRVLVDEFTDGNTTARNPWPANSFKRRFTLKHAPLTQQEWRYLRSFYTARSGEYDSFWFRDNVHRTGNAQVRFSKALAPEFSGSAINVSVELEETSVTRGLLEVEDIAAAASGITPVLWHDATRERYALNAGAVLTQPTLWDAAAEQYFSTWQIGGFIPGNLLSLFQTYHLGGANWAKLTFSSMSLWPLNGFSLFAWVKCSSSSTDQVLFSFDGTGLRLLSNQFTLENSAGGILTPYANSPADTWRAICVNRVPGIGGALNTTLYVEGQSQGFTIGTSNGSQTLSLGAAFDGTKLANASGAMTNCEIAHLLLFPRWLVDSDQVALRNLFASQFGLSPIS